MQADKEFGFSSKYVLGKKIGEGMHARCFTCTKKASYKSSKRRIELPIRVRGILDSSSSGSDDSVSAIDSAASPAFLAEQDAPKSPIAPHQRTGNKYAVKITYTFDMETILVTQREYNILRKLDHRNIVKVHDYFMSEESGMQHMVMEYIEGTQLLDHIAGGNAYTEHQACNYFTQLLEGLAYLHS